MAQNGHPAYSRKETEVGERYTVPEEGVTPTPIQARTRRAFGSVTTVPELCRTWARIYDGEIGDPTYDADLIYDEGLTAEAGAMLGDLARWGFLVYDSQPGGPLQKAYLMINTPFPDRASLLIDDLNRHEGIVAWGNEISDSRPCTPGAFGCRPCVTYEPSDDGATRGEPFTRLPFEHDALYKQMMTEEWFPLSRAARAAVAGARWRGVTVLDAGFDRGHELLRTAHRCAAATAGGDPAGARRGAA